MLKCAGCNETHGMAQSFNKRIFFIAECYFRFTRAHTAEEGIIGIIAASKNLTFAASEYFFIALKPLMPFSSLWLCTEKFFYYSRRKYAGKYTRCENHGV